jgi:hypothetical protein
MGQFESHCALRFGAHNSRVLIDRLWSGVISKKRLKGGALGRDVTVLGLVVGPCLLAPQSQEQCA